MAIDEETDQYQNSNLLQKKADLENLFTTDTTNWRSLHFLCHFLRLVNCMKK